MPIGVDGVLLASWAAVEGSRRILDVGTGCGVIALICAQRAPEATVTAIDIHRESVAEATLNFENSPWCDRLSAVNSNFMDILPSDGVYDFIISNPPFFNSGVNTPSSPRETARHQGELSPLTLVRHSEGLLVWGGRVAVVMPADRQHDFEANLNSPNLRLRRRLYVKGNPGAPVKRVMLEYEKVRDVAYSPIHTVQEETLVIETSPGEYTSRYMELGKDFYLKF